MGILSNLKGALSKMFKWNIKEEFNVSEVSSQYMETKLDTWLNVYRGHPDWVDEKDNIKTINFAETVCSETARLTTLDIDVAFDGGRADYFALWFNKSVISNLRTWVEYGCALGTIVLKPNGSTVDLILPSDFYVTSVDDGKITGAVFQDSYLDGKDYYTKLEYHRFVDDDYLISNRTYISKSASELGKPIDIRLTRWNGLMEDVPAIRKADGNRLDGMLFGVFKMPKANNVDFGSPLGMAIYSNAIEELKDLDIAYSRNSIEVKHSQKIALVDERLLRLPSVMDENGKMHRQTVKMPEYVKNVSGSDEKEFYQEITPQLNTTERKVGIDQQLSMIGYKCGYSNGYFVLDAKTGLVTATQVEADDRRTIQLIKDVRDALKTCIKGLVYAQSVMADLYGYAPTGDYEIHYNFGDITYNYEEDKQRHWNYVQSGKYPLWMYYVKFEGMSEEEAKAIEEEVSAKEKGLFDE